MVHKKNIDKGRESKNSKLRENEKERQRESNPEWRSISKKERNES